MVYPHDLVRVKRFVPNRLIPQNQSPIWSHAKARDSITLEINAAVAEW